MPSANELSSETAGAGSEPVVLETVEGTSEMGDATDAPATSGSEEASLSAATEYQEASLAYQDFTNSVNMLTCFGVYLILGVLLVRFFLEKVRG